MALGVVLSEPDCRTRELLSERVEPGVLKTTDAEPPPAWAEPPPPPRLMATAPDCELELAVPVPVAVVCAIAGLHTARSMAAVTRSHFIV
jgi:hypothetical protein